MEALLLNSDWFATADRWSSNLEEDGEEEEGEEDEGPGALLVGPFDADFFNLSAMVWNSCVRSRNDDWVDLNCILFKEGSGEWEWNGNPRSNCNWIYWNLW